MLKKIVYLAFVMVASSWFSQEAEAQIFRTNLECLVISETGAPQAGATVKLYKSEADYEADKNAVKTGKSDEDGKVKFKKLDPVSYFYRATKGDLDNADSAHQTPALTENKLNKLNIVISGFTVPK